MKHRELMGNRSTGVIAQMLSCLASMPWIRTAKLRMRDAWWTVRGMAVRNPHLPMQPRTLLFVCKGNICRSPFAAAVATRWLQGAARPDVRCLSAGFRVSDEDRSPLEAVQAGRRFGVVLDHHRSAPLSAQLMEAADAVVVMEVAHLSLLRRHYPALRNRVYLLPLFEPGPARPTGYFRYTIADPYGQPAEAFSLCYGRIAVAIDGMFRAVFGGSVWCRG